MTQTTRSFSYTALCKRNKIPLEITITITITNDLFRHMNK